MTNTTNEFESGLRAIGTVHPSAIHQRLSTFIASDRPALRRLWNYYANPMTVRRDLPGDSTRPYRQGQEWGLPSRISGFITGGDIDLAQPAGPARKEVVIENEIAWRIDTMIDYLFGRNVILHSAAPDPARAAEIQPILDAILTRAGGLRLLQQVALLGAVYGFVDLVITLDTQALSRLTGADADANRGASRPGRSNAAGAAASSPSLPKATATPREEDPTEAKQAPGNGLAQDANGRANSALAGRRFAPEDLASLLRIEVVDPSRAIAWTDPSDYRVTRLYGQLYTAERQPAAHQGPAPMAPATRLFSRLSRWFTTTAASVPTIQVLELLSPTLWQRYEDGVLVASGGNSLGRLPVVHIQNTPLPFSYAGGSDVQPLIPLQDELNTRLSDRAYRVALQSMKMYLGKNITDFINQPVGPGRMWQSSDPDAQIVEVGGDTNNPSELAHIQDIREGLDKISGVSPVAAGAVQGKIGHLTSAAALRITLMSLLARTDRKRAVYGAALQDICELALAWLDTAGVFPTTPAERVIEINWPSPLPENEMEKLDEAKAKLELGVAQSTVLRELGYDIPVSSAPTGRDS